MDTKTICGSDCVHHGDCPPPRFIYDDGGRKEAGFLGTAGDCVTRSIAIATETPYLEVYNALHEAIRSSGCVRRVAGKSPRNGVPMTITRRYLAAKGWEWTPTMSIGSGCTVHLKAEELPEGRLIVRSSKHLVAVIDGMIHDTYDPSRDGTRCVYGYFSKGA